MTENQNQSPVMSLATETLLYIFELVHHEIGWEIPLKPDNPRLFPFAQARVCRRWLDVLVILPPTCWKQIVVPLDAPVLPSSIAAYVAASGEEKRMNVHVFSQPSVSEADASQQHPVLTPHAECQRVDMAMQHLAPHLARFRTLSIRTHYRSAALVAMKHISAAGNAPLLENLDVVSRVADTTAPASFISLTSPWLANLAIDMRSFIDLVHSGSKIGGGEHEEDEDSWWLNLKLTSYRPTSGPPGLTPTALIDAIDKFAVKDRYDLSLEIDDVAFDDEDSDQASSESRPRRRTTQLKPKKLDQLDTVTLSSLDYPFLKAFFDRYEPQRSYLGDGGRFTVTLSQCAITGPLSIRVVPGLCLSRIQTHEEILSAFRGWSGAELEIRDCPAFDDAIIDTLHTSRPGLMLCTELEYLTITRCPGVSAQALRKLLVGRKMWLRELNVHGAPRPIEEKEEKGFGELVERFRWSEY